MSRYHGPKIKITRRLGNLPGLTQKTSNKEGRPGQHGKKRRKLTEYGLRLEEKQKLKFNYGLEEKQLYRYVKEARRRKGVTGLILFQLLEMRLDSICFALHFAKTIAGARQLVNHNHIMVNDKSVNIPSFQCQLNDIISFSSKISNESRLPLEKIISTASHLELDKLGMEGKITDYCSPQNISLNLNELLVIEHYSRR